MGRLLLPLHQTVLPRCCQVLLFSRWPLGQRRQDNQAASSFSLRPCLAFKQPIWLLGGGAHVLVAAVPWVRPLSIPYSTRVEQLIRHVIQACDAPVPGLKDHVMVVEAG